MVKHTQTIRLKVFDHFVGLALKGLSSCNKVTVTVTLLYSRNDNYEEIDKSIETNDWTLKSNSKKQPAKSITKFCALPKFFSSSNSTNLLSYIVLTRSCRFTADINGGL